MRLTLLTLVILVSLDADLAVLLWVAALTPGIATLAFVCLLRPFRRPPPRRRGYGRDNSRWRGVHRRPRRDTPPGRHTPARGKRLKGISRQAQLEEQTVSVDAAQVLGTLKRPADMPDVGRNGFSSWT